MVTFEEMPLDILLVIIKFIAQLPEAQDCAPGETLGNLSSTSHGMRKLVAPILFDRLFIYASTWSATGQRTMRYALDAIRASGLLQQARHLTVYMEAADLRWHFSDDFIDLLKSVPHLQTMHYPYFEVAEAPEDVLDAINIHPTLRVVELELLSPDYTGSHGEDLSKYRYSHYTIDSDVPDKVDLVNSTTKRGASLTALTVFQKDSEMRWPIEAIRGLQKISFFGCYPPTSDAFIHRHSTLTRIKITGNKPNEALPTVLWTSIPLLRDSLEVYYDTNGPSLCLRTAVLSRSHVNERWACTEAAWIVECSDEEQLMYAVQAMSTAFPALQSLRISVLQDSKIITPRSSITFAEKSGIRTLVFLEDIQFENVAFHPSDPSDVASSSESMRQFTYYLAENLPRLQHVTFTFMSSSKWGAVMIKAIVKRDCVHSPLVVDMQL